MARHFEPATGELRTDIGAANIVGNGTIAAIVKLDQQGAWQQVVGLHGPGDPGSGNFLRMEMHPSNAIHFGTSVGSQESPTITLTTAEGWALLAVGKEAAPNDEPRYHKYLYSSGVWTHEDGPFGVPAGVAPGATGKIHYGEWENTDNLDGDIALAGIWDYQLSDAEVENLAHSLHGWVATATAPLVVHLFDQDDAADDVVDLMGSGADEQAGQDTATITVAPYPPAIGYFEDPIRIIASGAAAVSTRRYGMPLLGVS